MSESELRNIEGRAANKMVAFKKGNLRFHQSYRSLTDPVVWLKTEIIRQY